MLRGDGPSRRGRARAEGSEGVHSALSGASGAAQRAGTLLRRVRVQRKRSKRPASRAKARRWTIRPDPGRIRHFCARFAAMRRALLVDDAAPEEMVEEAPPAAVSLAWPQYPEPDDDKESSTIHQKAELGELLWVKAALDAGADIGDRQSPVRARGWQRNAANACMGARRVLCQRTRRRNAAGRGRPGREAVRGRVTRRLGRLGASARSVARAHAPPYCACVDAPLCAVGAHAATRGRHGQPAGAGAAAAGPRRRPGRAVPGTARRESGG